MLTGSRVLFSDNGTITDLSRSVTDLFAASSVLPWVAAQDKLYLGSDQPFNHRYFKMSVLNDQAAVISIDIWDGTAWVPAVDEIDFTSLAGVAWAANGIVQWTTDRTSGWNRIADSNDITGLSGTHIYDMFWARITMSGDLKATTALSYVGHKFSDDSLLGGYYPDLVRTKLLAAFASGKTNWEEQHVLAAEELIRDLRKRRYAASGSSVFDWELFSVPAMHKTAQIIMAGLGPDFADRAVDAQESYQNELENTLAGLDRDQDGRLSPQEKLPSVGLWRV